MGQNILAIESAVGEGSIALLCKGDEQPIDGGNGGVSRAEKIISEIDLVFQKANFSKDRLDLIAVSIGPGSYSGIRIGVSTALGLGNSLNIPVVGVSVLDAIAGNVIGEKVIAVVPVGKSDLAWQVFETDVTGKKRAVSDPALDPINSFSESLKAHRHIPIVTPSVQSLHELVGSSHKVLAIGSSVAAAIARLAAESGLNLPPPKPIYMRSAVARSST